MEHHGACSTTQKTKREMLIRTKAEEGNLFSKSASGTMRGKLCVSDADTLQKARDACRINICSLMDVESEERLQMSECRRRSIL